MKKIYSLLPATMLTCATASMAQRPFVAIDVDAGVPIAGASITTNGGVFTTDSMGHFAVPDTCSMMFITHLNYESRLVKLSEVRDTVFLISKELNLRELVVFGTGPEDENIKRLNKSLRMEKVEAQLATANLNQGLNLFGLFKALVPKKWRKNAKAERRKQLRKTLEKY